MPKERKIPQRMCVGCRVMKNKRELIRVVRTPAGTVEMDITGKKPGRGAYICRDPECLQLASKDKRLQKALQQEISEDVLGLLREQMIVP